MPKAKSTGKASGKTEERQESGKPLPWCTLLTQKGKDTKTQETTLPGYRGETPVLSPRGTESVRYMGLNQAGAGVYIGLYDSWPCGLYQQTRGSARWALPLFSLLLPTQTGEGNAPPCTPPANAVGGW